MQKHIVKTLAYFDVFSYPLSAEQVYRSLQTNSVTSQIIARELGLLASRKAIGVHGRYYFLRHRNAQIVSCRLNSEHHARKLLLRAKMMVRLVRQFPFVRCICLSGELSKNVAREGSDVDFFIITAPRRVWICRALLTLFKKIFLLNRRKYFCLNYFLAEDRLTVENQNLFTAMETATLMVMWNETLFRKFFASNEWVYRFLPNWERQPRTHPVSTGGRSLLQKASERLLSVLPLDTIDNWLMDMMKRVWKKRYKSLSEEKREELYQSTPNVSTAYGHDYQEIIFREYNRRLKMYDIATADANHSPDPKEPVNG
ncbi:MAG: hypothetical protein KGJ59_06320 [Bacteroidota bacterium]|nr:hypothetical protein [Bacteroidota bacterium]